MPRQGSSPVKRESERKDASQTCLVGRVAFSEHRHEAVEVKPTEDAAPRLNVVEKAYASVTATTSAEAGATGAQRTDLDDEVPVSEASVDEGQVLHLLHPRVRVSQPRDPRVAL